MQVDGEKSDEDYVEDYVPTSPASSVAGDPKEDVAMDYAHDFGHDDDGAVETPPDQSPQPAQVPESADDFKCMPCDERVPGILPSPIRPSKEDVFFTSKHANLVEIKGNVSARDFIRNEISEWTAAFS